MSTKSSAIDQWRKYFESANADIFEVIEQAITVAATDRPKEFKVKRDRIAEKLFTCQLNRCLGCDHVELAVGDEEGDGSFKSNLDESGVEGKESKVNSSRNDQIEMNGNQECNYNFDVAEALTEEIEEENQIIGEVLRVKEILLNYEEEPDGSLFESLRRLQLMVLSVKTLKVTEIGKAVSGLRKHGSKEIRHLARLLINVWKETVDEWVSVNGPIAGADDSPESVNPSVVDEEEGLPFPPLDEGAFFTTQPTSMELSQFFDGMDDDGNLCNIREFDKKRGEFDKQRESGRKPTSENHITPNRKPQTPYEANMLKKENRSHQRMKEETPIKPTILFNTDSGPRRPPKLSSEHKTNDEMKLQQKLPSSNQQDKSKGSEDVSVRLKLEASKRKLHEGYQQAENAKKQRTIQVMELSDLPKPGMVHKSPHVKTGNHHRHWALNGRR